MLKLNKTFELSDLLSLEGNKLQPAVKHIVGNKTISLSSGPVDIYSLDNENKEILVVFNFKDTDPFILLMKEFPGFPPATLKEWALIGEGVFFDNPDEKDPNKLFGVKRLTTPSGRDYNRTIPKIVPGEKWGDAHLSAGLGKAVGTGLLGSLVGSITLYEAADTDTADFFFMSLNILNLANSENGGLMSIYSGHQIKPSEIN